MAGKKARSNKHREAYFKAHEADKVPEKNKARRWEARIRKMKAKAAKAGKDFSYPFKSYEAEAEACRQANLRAKQYHSDRRAQHREDAKARKHAHQKMEDASVES